MYIVLYKIGTIDGIQITQKYPISESDFWRRRGVTNAQNVQKISSRILAGTLAPHPVSLADPQAGAWAILALCSIGLCSRTIIHSTHGASVHLDEATGHSQPHTVKS